MDSLLLSVDKELSKDDNVLGVARTVRDPVLLRQRGRSIDDNLVRFGVVRGCGFHLDGVVAVAEFGEAEAADVGQFVDAFQ